MTYDALLVGRRGLGVEEMRLVSPGFASAVRWGVYVEKAYERVVDLTELVTTEVPDPKESLAKADARRMEFAKRQRVARTELAALRRQLLLDD